MFVTRASIDTWQGVFCSEREIAAPSLQQLAALLDLLDARVHTTLVLNGRDGGSLSIGGGGDQFLIFHTSPEEAFLNLRSDASPPDEIVLLNIGGQEGDYRRDQLASKRDAWQVLKLYAEHGKLDLSYAWGP